MQIAIINYQFPSLVQASYMGFAIRELTFRELPSFVSTVQCFTQLRFSVHVRVVKTVSTYSLVNIRHHDILLLSSTEFSGLMIIATFLSTLAIGASASRDTRYPPCSPPCCNLSDDTTQIVKGTCT